MISGICNGSRAIAANRIGHGLSHHNRTMLTFAGNTARNSAAATAPPRRRVRGVARSPAVVSSATPDAYV